MHRYILEKKNYIPLYNNIINDDTIDDTNIAIIICNYTNYNININKLNSNIKTFYITNSNMDININNIEIIKDDNHSQYINFNNNANKNKELLIETFYKTQILNLDKINNYKYILWIDKNVNIDTINNLLNNIKTILKNKHDIFIYSSNKNIRNEHKDASLLLIYDNQKLFEQVKQNIHNNINNIYNTNFIIYKNCNKIKLMMNNWWNEINNYSLNDKISFSYVLHKNNIHYKILSNDVFTENNNLDKIDINNKINLIDKILWINLDRCLSRKIYMENLLKDITIENIRISAIDGSTYNYNLHVRNMTFERRHLTNYEIACTLSHLKIIETLKTMNGNYFMICEDDVSFNNIFLFDNNLETIIKNAPLFDILILFKFSSNYYTSDYTKWNISNCSSTASYIISRNGINKLSLLYNYDKINDIYTFNKPIDVSDIFLYKNVDTYIYRYNYITVLNNDSTIHSEHLNWQKKYTEIQNNMIYK